MISLIRCDDRLVHGQCMIRIVPHYAIKKIIVIDDYTASDRILKSIFEKAVPPSMSCKVFKVSDCESEILDALNSDISTLLLTRNLLVAYKVFSAIKSIPKAIMVGPQSKKPGYQEVNTGTYIGTEEINAVEQMTNDGIEVYFQVIPDQKKYTWSEVKKSLK